VRTQGVPLEQFHEKFAVQLNDTHPAIAIAELMRLLIDDYAVSWAEAWNVTTRTFAYTNHTLLPEALERWPLEVFGRVLPRHLQIIYDINAHFLEEVRMRFLGDEDRIRRMSIIDESGERYVRMAHLACIGSHAINGVAALHTELLKSDVLQGLLRALAAEVQQQDQRRHPAPLDGAVQSAALRAHHRAHRRPAGSRTWRSSRGSSRSPRMPSFAPAGARSS
jgi:glucan phosphorylase